MLSLAALLLLALLRHCFQCFKARKEMLGFILSNLIECDLDTHLIIEGVVHMAYTGNTNSSTIGCNHNDMRSSTTRMEIVDSTKGV